MSHLRHLVIALVLLTAFSASAQSSVDVGSFLRSRGINAAGKRAEFSIDSLALTRLHHGAVVEVAHFPVGLNEQATVVLKRRSERLLSHTKLHIERTNGDTLVPAPALDFFQGAIEGEPNSRISFASANGFIFCTIDREDGSRYTLAPSLGDHALTVLMRDEDIFEGQDLRPIDCRTTGLPGVDRTPKAAPAMSSALSNTLLEVETAVEADSMFYFSAGHDELLVSVYVASLYAMVSAQFENEFGVTMSLSWVKIWTVHDPYNVAGNAYILMDTARAYWKLHYADVPRDVAHVMTSIGYGGGGFAYFSLCDKDQSFGVSSPQTGHTYPTFAFTYDAYIVAHEMGHNFGAPHSHSCWWNPPLDTCWTKDDAALKLDDACYSKPITPRPNPGSIMSYCANANYTLSGNDFSKFKLEMTYTPRVAAVLRSTAESATCLTEPFFKTVILTSPRGGTSLKGNDSADFHWLQAGLTNVEIEYSPDDMNSWHPLWSGLASDATVKLPMPNITSTKLWFRIKDKELPEIADTSLIVMSITKTASVRTAPSANVAIYPNPSSSELQFGLTRATMVVITDALGRTAFSAMLNPDQKLDVSMLPAGIYSAAIGGSSTRFVISR